MSLSNLFKSCLDILRDGSEHLTGDKALRCLGNFLTLKLMSGKIDFDSYDGYIGNRMRAKNVKHLLEFEKFDEEPEENLVPSMKKLIDYFLSQHPDTKDIFPKDVGLGITSTRTFKKIIDKLHNFNFKDLDHDIQGVAYEEVIKDIMVGKVFGQFFTPPKIKQMMVNLIAPKVLQDGKIETIFDPAMGTGGFLITALRHLNKHYKDQFDKEYAFSEGLGGNEIEPDTFRLAKSNMLISSGKMFRSLFQKDSLRAPIPTNKYDIVLANPPFGIRVKYQELKATVTDRYLPIKVNSAVALFLQGIIYMLKVRGRCAVILPTGKELFSTQKAFVTVREYLMKTCDLKEIIQLPAGAFSNTAIKTCVFYFHKKISVEQGLIEIKRTKTRNYKFCEEHQTESVKFYDYNLETKTKTLIVEVNIKDIKDNKYILNPAEYIEEEEEDFGEDVKMRYFGEVFDFQIGKRQASKCDNSGKYKFITTSTERTDSNYDIDEEALFINTNTAGGNKFITKLHYYNGKCSFSTLVSRIIPLCEDINLKFYFYYLKYIKTTLEKYHKGLGPMKLHTDLLKKKLKIPIPSLARQQEIVDQMDFLYEESIKTSERKIAQLKKANEMRIRLQMRDPENEVKTLGEVCEVKTGKYITKDMKNKGKYPIYGGGDISGYIDLFNRNNSIVIAKDGISKSCVRYVVDSFFLNHHGWTLDIIENIIDKMFLYFYLKCNEHIIYDTAKGAAQKGINQSNFYKLKIKVPPLACQQEVVEFCEANDSLIKSLEQDIERSREMGKMILSNLGPCVSEAIIPESPDLIDLEPCVSETRLPESLDLSP